MGKHYQIRVFHRNGLRNECSNDKNLSSFQCVLFGYYLFLRDLFYRQLLLLFFFGPIFSCYSSPLLILFTQRFYLYGSLDAVPWPIPKVAHFFLLCFDHFHILSHQFHSYYTISLFLAPLSRATPSDLNAYKMSTGVSWYIISIYLLIKGSHIAGQSYQGKFIPLLMGFCFSFQPIS